MSAPRDYKDTINLPKTDFPMKGNLAQLEPRMLERWDKEGTFARVLEKNAGKPRFVFHDGPPYANGHIHIGHALNKILKDMVVKYRNLSGRQCDFVPGWDCHGLPIEQAVEKRLREKKVDKRTLSRDQFLEACRGYATEFIDVQRAEFQRLGLFGQWSNPYKTLTFDYEAQEIRELATFARGGYLYRKKKPVYWCLADQTALAEAEVEYEDHASPSVYVAMPAAEGELSAKWPQLLGKKVAFVIWTTTPWTLPANLAVAVNPGFTYVFYALGDRVLVVARDLLAKVMAEVAPGELQVKDAKLPGGELQAVALCSSDRVLGYAEGSELEGLSYRHPFLERTGKVILGEHVTLEAGTGLVHTAPGHGQEDYEVGLRYGLDVYNPVRNDGRYDDTVGPRLAGMKVFEANPVVVDWLVEAGALLNDKADKVSHSYPHCWRCHNPVIFRATHQWFINLAHGSLRQKALDEIDRVQWIPKWGRDRIFNMLEGRPDWCISRQRTWGVPIPVALCEGCGHAHVDAAFMEKVADAVEKEGAGAWYRAELSDLLPAGFACPSCGKSQWRKETDILDVWFDSACSFAAVAAKRPNHGLPVDLYLEGSDQHRGWFHSSLLVGVGTRGRAPYEAVLTHGFVVDGQGRKMSKSLGNVVPPEKVINQYGAEILRLWVASADYRDDVRVSDEILRGLAETYRKVRNTLRYALSNLYDFDPAKDAVPDAELLPLDRWAKLRLSELVEKVTRAFEAYEFHLVNQAVVDFCAVDLSAVYFDINKDRLYTSRADSRARRSAQTVMHELARTLLLLVAPVMSFTAEEAWGYLPGDKAASVFLGEFPKARGVTDADRALLQRFEKLFAVRSAVQGLLEAARRDKRIGSSVEAQVVLHATGEAKAFLEAHAEELPAYFIVSQVTWAGAPPEGGTALALAPVFGTAQVHAAVTAADGAKCPRCWQYSAKVGAGQETCDRCEDALR
ncbi:MAG: isoleucine--tRNA ligase [Deltaproteobacteria bacterium]|nr:isoleucine--tRNA ligase [Deltaproteobacteria bacterium]